MENKDWKKIVAAYLAGTLNPSEIDDLFQTLGDAQYSDQWRQVIDQLLADRALHGHADKRQLQKVLQTILQQQELPSPVVGLRRFGRNWGKAAAIFLLASLGAATYWKMHQHRPAGPTDPAVVLRFKNDLPPGRDKAILTLADGRHILLDSAGSGTLAREGNTSIKKSADGQITYTPVEKKAEAALLYNTVSTPGRGQYHLTLADGTRVWLDAASSLRYPVQFDANQRVVELSGQAYFEVTGNPHFPFLVKVNAATVQVLGTRFNIDAFDQEEAMRTTLLDGQIKVGQRAGSVLLRPGQQAAVRPDDSIRILDNPDLEEVMAWKNGVFLLRSAGIRSIMRQVARWYDVEVEYKGAEINQTFYGTIPRNVSAVNLFKVLEETGYVHFSIAGRKVTVSP